MNPDKIIIYIFEKLLTFKHLSSDRRIKTVSIECRTVNNFICCFASILIKEDCVINANNDEIVLEVSSNDSKTISIDISDSFGHVYKKCSEAMDKNAIDHTLYVMRQYINEVLVMMCKS